MNKLSRRQSISILVVMCAFTFLGFVSGFYFGTGMLPTFTKTEGVLVPETTTTTLTDVQTTLSEVDFPEYEFGYNCVDFAWAAMRQLAWSGQPAAIVTIMYEEEPYHALVLTATEDEGWVFIDTQTGAVVKPYVGGHYSGRVIIAIKVLTLVWVPIDEFVQSPIFEEIIPGR